MEHLAVMVELCTRVCGGGPFEKGGAGWCIDVRLGDDLLRTILGETCLSVEAHVKGVTCARTCRRYGVVFLA